MTKAFNSVSHPILLQQLFNFWINCKEQEITLIKSYLAGRRQYVETKNAIDKQIILKTKCKYRWTKYPLPQGSVLGPFLVVHYLGGFPKRIPELRSRAYCSKFGIFAEDVIKQFLTRVLMMFSLKQNQQLKLQLNKSKTTFMKFSCKTFIL